MNRTDLRDIPIRLAPPTPVPTVPDIPDGEPNLLPKAALLAPLRVEFPVWEGAVTDPSDPGDTLCLYWDGVEVDSKLFTADDVIPANLFMTVPRDRLSGDGEHQVQYVAYNSVGNPVGSAPAPVWIDTVEPGHNDVLLPLVPDPVVPNDIVNEAYLAANGDQVLAKILPYVETRVGDLIQGFWQPDLLPEQDAADAQTVVDQQAIGTGEIVLVFSGRIIRQKGNGRARVWYRITDRAGNVSAHSDERQWLVEVLVPPTALRPPRIPQAADGLLSRADACDKVLVVLDGYSVPTAGDLLLVTFNSTALAPVPAPAAAGFPVSVEVPWDILRGYGETAPYQAVVYWQVQRGAFVSPPSATLTVNVDLRIPGPANPSPCPLNLALAPVVVRGGGRYPFDNVIYPLDANLPATATVALYANPQPGEVMGLYWGTASTPLATYTVEAGDEEGDPVSFIIEWATIQATGDQSAWPVHFRISNGVNEQQAPDTAIVIMLTPSSGQYLPDATFVHASINNYISCSTVPPPSQGIALHVPAGNHFAGATRLYLLWRGYKGVNLTDPRPQTNEVFDVPIPADAQAQGVDFTVGATHEEFVRLVQPIGFEWGAGNDRQNGSAEVFYIVFGGAVTVSMSRPRSAYVSLELVPPGSVCPCDGQAHDDEQWCKPVN
ncbi:hypothetical protein [Pseudomonas sp. TE3610]